MNSLCSKELKIQLLTKYTLMNKICHIIIYQKKHINGNINKNMQGNSMNIWDLSQGPQWNLHESTCIGLFWKHCCEHMTLVWYIYRHFVGNLWHRLKTHF